MRLVTQNFTWLTCKDCGDRIALYPGREYDSIKCQCAEPKEVQYVDVLKRDFEAKDANDQIINAEDSLKLVDVINDAKDQDTPIELKKEAKRGRSRKVTETVQESV